MMRNRWTLQLCTTATATLLTSGFSLGQSSGGLPQEVLTARRAVVVIKSFDAASRELGMGSGFYIAGGRLVTNAHVVAGAARVEVFDADNQLLGGASFAESITTTRDLVVLPAMGQPPAVLRLASQEPSVGDRVVAIGAPQGLSNTISEGIISAIRDFDGQRWIQTTAPISQGSSGGPLLNLRGEVVGVNSGMMRDGQNLNFAVPARDVIALASSPAGRLNFPPAPAADDAAASSRSNAGAQDWYDGGVITTNTIVPDQLRAKMNVYSFEPNLDGEFVFAASSARTYVSVSVVDVSGREAQIVAAASDEGKRGAVVRFSTRRGGRYVLGVFSASGQGSFQYYVAPVYEGRWLLVAEAEEGWVFADLQTFSSLSGGMTEGWTRVLLRQPERANWSPYPTYDRAEYLETVDCRDRSSSSRQSAHYLRTTVVDTDRYAARWSRPTPGSVPEALIEEVCFLAALNQ